VGSAVAGVVDPVCLGVMASFSGVSNPGYNSN
jgi:hypothetical protein